MTIYTEIVFRLLEEKKDGLQTEQTMLNGVHTPGIYVTLCYVQQAILLKKTPDTKHDKTGGSGGMKIENNLK